MDFIAKLSDITINFTPDEWEKVKRIGDFSIANIEEINAKGYEEDPEKLPQIKTQYKFEQVMPCVCKKYYRNRLWIAPDCKAKHSKDFTLIPIDK